MTSDLGRDKGIFSCSSNAGIGKKSQNDPKSSYRSGSYGLEDATWEHEDSMQAEYPQLFK
jgi:hypothetical protein